MLVEARGIVTVTEPLRWNYEFNLCTCGVLLLKLYMKILMYYSYISLMWLIRIHGTLVLGYVISTW